MIEEEEDVIDEGIEQEQDDENRNPNNHGHKKEKKGWFQKMNEVSQDYENK